MLMEIIPICSESHIKQTGTLCEQKETNFFNVNAVVCIVTIVL
jgi:hypothetical protein